MIPLPGYRWQLTFPVRTLVLCSNLVPGAEKIYIDYWGRKLECFCLPEFKYHEIDAE